jgi:hypothetical protein
LNFSSEDETASGCVEPHFLRTPLMRLFLVFVAGTLPDFAA